MNPERPPDMLLYTDYQGRGIIHMGTGYPSSLHVTLPRPHSCARQGQFRSIMADSGLFLYLSFVYVIACIVRPDVWLRGGQDWAGTR